jgi:GNAT superfamily N-acetyltransferase
MVGTQIRLADEADVPLLAGLRGRWTVENTGESADATFDARFDDWYSTERHRRTFWLAETDHEPTGMVNLLLFERMPRPGRDAGRWGYLGNMFVVSEHRRSGIGTVLLAAVLQHATAADLERLVLSPSQASIPFWRRSGFINADELLVHHLGHDQRRNL